MIRTALLSLLVGASISFTLFVAMGFAPAQWMLLIAGLLLVTVSGYCVALINSNETKDLVIKLLKKEKKS